MSTENSRPPSSPFEEAENSTCTVTLDTDSVDRQEVVTESICSPEDSGPTRVAGGANINVEYAAILVPSVTLLTARRVDTVGGVETNGTETERGEQDAAQSFQETGPVVSTQLTEK